MGTALLTAVSHDLRTPLAGIKAAISGLMMDDVWAGLFAALGVVVLAGLAHGVLMR